RDENDRERRLHDEQRLARERRVIAGRSPGPAKRVNGIRARREPRGRGAEDDPRDERDRKRESEHHQRRRRADRKEMRVPEREREEQPRGARRYEEAGT